MEWARMAVYLFAAVNPGAVALAAGDAGSLRLRQAGIALTTALAIFAAATFGAGRFLDFLDIPPETFRIAAGAVMAVTAGFVLWRAFFVRRDDLPEPMPGLLAGWPGIANPAAVIAAVSLAGDHNGGGAFTAAVLAAALAALALGAGAARWRLPLASFSGLTAALLVAVAAALIVSGVQSV